MLGLLIRRPGPGPVNREKQKGTVISRPFYIKLGIFSRKKHLM